MTAMNRSGGGLGWVLGVWTALAGFGSGGEAGFAQAAPAAGLTERFAHPPRQDRILKIIHSWPDAPEAQDRIIRTLTKQGFGGVVCNVSFDHYLESDTHWTAFTRAIKAAHEAGFAMWLYDEKGYPSVSAGGLVLRDHPEWEAAGWLVADARTDGGTVTLEAPPGRLVLAAAYPVAGGSMQLERRVDLADKLVNGQLNWQAPAGSWRVLLVTQSRLFEGTHAELNLAAKLPYPNLLQPEPTARFLELTHDNYARRLGDDLGRYFLGTFTDEPSLMSVFLRPMPYRVLPWATNLPVEFLKRRGYALEPILPLLVGDGGPRTAKARYDYWLTIGELVSENFCGQIQQWCARHNLPSGGHLLAEENLLAHVPFYGDFFRCLRRLDAPSIDCLTSLPPEVPWYIGRLAASAAELEGKSLVMCEVSDHSQRYRPAGDKRPIRPVTETEIRGTCNRLMVGGVNNFTSYYSFADLTDEQLGRINEWVGRCCTLLRGGHQAADLAVLYPAESVWTRFTPARHWAKDSAAAAQIESGFHLVSDELFRAGRDFTYVDGRTLAQARVAAGRLVHGESAWRVIVLPWADTLPLAAWENLAAFVQQGGRVIALGRLPANSETDFPSARVQTLATGLFGTGGAEPRVQAGTNGGAGVFLPGGAEGLLRGLVDQLLEPDVQVIGQAAPVRNTHRRVAGQELYFLVNDSPQAWQGDVRFRAEGPAQVWRPESGAVAELPARTNVSLTLPPYGGAFVTFPRARAPRPISLASGPLPGLQPLALTSAQPELGGGEFVRQEVTQDQELARPNRPAWRVTGTLKKGQVDTWLFARFACGGWPALGGEDLIALESWVPDHQASPAELLVILHEKGGGDYLANTGRFLGQAGRQITYLPLRRFQLAGWSKDPNGRLDPSEVVELRIGWGGYLGTEGETIRFSLAAPQALRRAGP